MHAALKWKVSFFLGLGKMTTKCPHVKSAEVLPASAICEREINIYCDQFMLSLADRVSLKSQTVILL